MACSRWFRGAAVGVLGGITLSLHGCGSETRTTTGTSTTTTTTPKPGPLPPQPAQAFIPVKGIIYSAKPVKDPAAVNFPSDDMMQQGAARQWHSLRDDLGVIRMMGANTVRVIGIGRELHTDHKPFLDRCSELGLNVIVEFYKTGVCPEFDCFVQWKTYTMNALEKQGFKQDGKWHPAIQMLLLIQQPDDLDFSDGSGAQPLCDKEILPDGQEVAKAWCRTKAVLSAMDGVLAAEKAVGIDGQDVFIGVAWSFATFPSIDGKDFKNLYGFQDMTAAIEDPELARYSFKTEGYEKAYERRWVHAINTQAQWSYVKEKVLDLYSPFEAQKLLLSGMVFPETLSPDVVGDLKKINEEANQSTFFMGAVYQGFQTDYIAQDPNHGLFGLGSTKLGSETMCQEDPRTPENKDCHDFDVWCLDMKKGASYTDQVIEAWGGYLKNALGVCEQNDADALIADIIA